MTKPKPPRLVWLHERRPGEQLRIYQKKYQGRPFYSLETWAVNGLDWRCVGWLALRRFDLRPLLRGVAEAVKDSGVSLRRDEREIVEVFGEEVQGQ